MAPPPIESTTPATTTTVPTTSSRRQSCDRCYGQKLRCTRQGKEGACNRCLKQGAQCKLQDVQGHGSDCGMLPTYPGIEANYLDVSNRCIQYAQSFLVAMTLANMQWASAYRKEDRPSMLDRELLPLLQLNAEDPRLHNITISMLL